MNKNKFNNKMAEKSDISNKLAKKPQNKAYEPRFNYAKKG